MNEGKKSIQIRLLGYETPEYQATLALRYEILRQPLGLTFAQDQLKAEASDYHLGAFQENKLVGCVVLSPQKAGVVKMRQMAVIKNSRNKGVGKALVSQAEILAKEKGFKQIFLHARYQVKEFYENLGYRATTNPFKEITLWHVKMEKSLVES